ncbi:hypothetical protein WJ73_19570 [Burkholderia ubonensis]|nr:hypothetical protein WJ73_19570 [Burkholderia ubonensis]
MANKRFHENLGRVVRVERIYDHAFMAGPAWLVTSLSSPLACALLPSGPLQYLQQAVIRDRNLRPLPDEFDVDSVPTITDLALGGR